MNILKKILHYFAEDYCDHTGKGKFLTWFHWNKFYVRGGEEITKECPCGAKFRVFKRGDGAGYEQIKP